ASFQSRLRAVAVCLLWSLPLVSMMPPAEAQIAVRNQGYIPFSDAPIFYRSEDIDDPVKRLQQQIEQGKAQLVYDAREHGYLKSVLKLLDVPISSQTLVFSKTSFQYPKIAPEHPRALYFNDDVYVGVVHQGKEIELVSFDARQGAIFYLLHEQQAETPAFERAELDCTQCHIAPSTRGVPGVMLRSVRPTSTGTLASGAPTFITDQESPLGERWGGWYATGKLASSTLANAVVAADATGRLPQLVPPEKSFDASAYLAPGSDEVALLVLAHQTQMHNLITLTNYKTRIALHALGKPGDGPLPEATRRQFERPAEQLLRYLLFSNEAPLPGLDGKQLIEASAFAREFAARGPRDSKGRSLRDFDLSTRTFRYPCSYLIYSEAFDALPEPSKSYVYDRLLQVLSGADQHEDFQSLSAHDRRAILEILLETKAGLPAQWQEYARHQGLQLSNQSWSQKGK
ncbi:MAG TPA: hypothetical protein VNR40_14290, partial [Steroidobacter sp.]|nr:hypothetical protein [Steroidobacter sp.]